MLDKGIYLESLIRRRKEETKGMEYIWVLDGIFFRITQYHTNWFYTFYMVVTAICKNNPTLI